MLLWAVASGIAVRVLFIEAVLPDDAFEANGVLFLEMARSLLEHGDPYAAGFHANRFDRGPAAAYAMGALGTFMDIVAAGRYLSALAGSALIPLVYLLARRLVPHDARVAGLAALATAWFPLLVEYSVQSYDDMLACLLFTLVIALLTQAADDPGRRLRHAATLGAVTAFGYLTRPSGLALVLVVLIVWVLLARSERSSWRGFLVPSAITLLTFAVLAAPYVHYISGLMGSFTLTAKSMVNLIWITEGPERNYELAGDELVWVAAMRESTPGQYIAAHWRQFVPAAVKGAQWMITDHLSHALSLPIALLAFHGFVTGTWDRARCSRELPIVLCLLALIAPLSVFGTLTPQFGRYLLPIIPISLVWCAKGIFELSDRARDVGGAGSRWPEVVQRSAVGLLVLYLVAGTLVGPGMKFARALDRPQLRAIQETGDWLRLHTPSDAVVCTSNNLVAFAAERSSVPEPVSDSVDRIAGYLDRYGVTYLALEDRGPYERSSRALTSESTLVHSVESGTRSIRVYRRRVAHARARANTATQSSAGHSRGSSPK